MRYLLILLSIAGLILTIVPAFLVLTGAIEFETNKTLMLIGTLCWFLTSPFWINKEKEAA